MKKNFSLQISSVVFLITMWFLSYSVHVSAAVMRIETHQKVDAVYSNPFVVQVTLDTEGETVSGISGDFSFSSEYFDVYSISTSEGVVTPWVEYPKISQERFLDGRTHIPFEGIFAGGFSGVKSAYYQGEKPGLLFSLVLIPKKSGVTTFLLSDVGLYGFNERASPVDVKVSPLTVTTLKTTNQPLPVIKKKQVANSNLEVALSRSSLIRSNAWYLSVTEKESYSPIVEMYVAETKHYIPENVSSNEWKSVSSPHVLTFQDRSRYIHVKVVYDNESYTFYTIPPVENSNTIRGTSRILIGIVITTLVILAIYATHLRFLATIKKRFFR